MKREDVKNKITGITEEQPNWLMQENGSDITREKFLSTLSLRRATCPSSKTGRRSLYFYPRSPCGERLDGLHNIARPKKFLSTLSLRRATFRVAVPEHTIVISIHALLAESDGLEGRQQLVGDISIHALLAESDTAIVLAPPTLKNFYPRSPCGERPPRLARVVPTPIFLSTLSLRRATGY